MTYDIVSERKGPEIKISGPADVFQAVRRYAKKEQEHFLVITLDSANKIIRVHIVFIGLLNRSLVHPREVFLRAIKDNSAGIIVSHNHPSGSLEPSNEDREVTRRLSEAGMLIGIPVLDHVLISKMGFSSFKTLGLLN